MENGGVYSSYMACHVAADEWVVFGQHKCVRTIHSMPRPELKSQPSTMNTAAHSILTAVSFGTNDGTFVFIYMTILNTEPILITIT